MAWIWNADSTNSDKNVEQQKHLFTASNKAITSEDSLTVSYKTKRTLTISYANYT